MVGFCGIGLVIGLMRFIGPGGESHGGTFQINFHVIGRRLAANYRPCTGVTNRAGRDPRRHWG